MHAAAQVEADLVVATGNHVHNRWIFRDVVDGFLASGLGAAGFSGDEDVEIAHRVAAPPQRSGRRDLVDALEFLDVGGDFLALDLGDVDEEASADATIVFDRLHQLGLVLLAHAGKFADFSFAREFLDTVDIADFVGAPDQRDRLGTEALNLEQLQHRGVIFCEQFSLDGEFSCAEELLQVGKHALANAGNGEHLLRIADDVFDLVRMVLDGLCGVAVRADAEGILSVDLEQVGGFEEDVGDSLVVHALKINQRRAEARRQTLLPAPHRVERHNTTERNWRRASDGERRAFEAPTSLTALSQHSPLAVLSGPRRFRTLPDRLPAGFCNPRRRSRCNEQIRRAHLRDR